MVQRRGQNEAVAVERVVDELLATLVRSHESLRTEQELHLVGEKEPHAVFRGAAEHAQVNVRVTMVKPIEMRRQQGGGDAMTGADTEIS